MGDLEPHIFAVAEEALTKMEREQRDQSIIVSGESGAGKTVSAKYTMRYFATVGGSATETHVEKKVLASSPIMEAIGNAKTTRNDNSSRFGKFIELQFSRAYNIIGASMRTYLLEKSRVVFQAPDERNYHIFYQLCAARMSYPHLKLDDPSSYKYLSEESVIPGIDDSEAFLETHTAFVTLGFSSKDMDDLFKVLAAVLHLGNIEIKEQCTSGDSEASYISDTDPHLSIIAELLQLNKKELSFWLCHRRIISMRETFDKPMTVQEAVGARDALAKHIYAELFSHIVSVINMTLEKASESRHKFIGVLDIYGFETFEINSFEQFCINYANEKLQQQFNQHVFKLEQEEYMKEEIEWKFIDFYDNQPCIDLIEAKLGILDLLDEECRMPKGSDNTWAEKLYSKCSKWQHFAKPRFGTNSFVIKHFADKVEYETAGFLEKNRDTVIEEQVTVVRSGGNMLIQRLFSIVEPEKKLLATSTMPRVRVPLTTTKTMSATMGATSKHKKSVGSQFRDSLNALMATLNATTPHYIRCIKPNDGKQAFEYNSQRAVQQLRACGVLETIRISAAGFPSRWLYVDFFSRYRVLCHSKDIQRNDFRITCERILSGFVKDTDKYKFGKTKIFFRAGQVAYLEKLRADRLKQCCLLIQKTVRGFLQRRRYSKIRRSAFCLQKYGRGLLARRYAHAIRRNKAAVTIQRHVRGWLVKTWFIRLKFIILRIQSRGRGLLGRHKFQQMQRNRAALIIGKHVRGWLCRLNYQRKRRQIIICQNTVRRFLARRILKKLKMEARSVEHVKSLNKGLENKIISLQQRIEELLKENAVLRISAVELIETRGKLEVLRNVENERKKQMILVVEKDNKLATLTEELEIEKQKIVDLLSEKGSLESELEKLKELWNEEKSGLEMHVKSLKDENESIKYNSERMLQTRLEQEKIFLIKEQDQDRIAYQKLLAEKNQLEAQFDSLSREVNNLKQSSHHRSLSDISSHSATDDTHEETGDIGIVIKLQQKIKALENEKDRLHRLIDVKSESSNENRMQDEFKLQQLEMENSKMKTDVQSLRKFISDSTCIDKTAAGEELMRQFEVMQAELSRKTEELVQLKSVLATKTQGIKNVASTNYPASDVNISLINEDGELVLAFEAQKKINRQLEDELQTSQKRWVIEKEELVAELSRLTHDNERQQKLLAGNLSKTPQSQNEGYLRHEISRLTNENLQLHEKKDQLVEQLRAVNKQLQDLRRRDGLVSEKVTDIQQAVVSSAGEKISNAPVVRKKETKTNYMGMFEFHKGDDVVIIRHLVHDLKPSIAVNLLPGLPAYILLMCIRHTDFINDEEKVRALLIGYINMVKKVIRRRINEFETMVLWLSNTLRLLHNLKQYSGDKAFKEENTVTQNEQCLRNFDLSEYRQVMSDTAVWIYQGVIRYTESKIQPKAIPAILEHEAISGLSGSVRPRAPSVTESSVTVQHSLDLLLQELTSFHRVLVCHAVDPELITQVFQQLFYYICASSLNNLLLRKDLCHWSKGMQIRYNLSHLEQWARDQKLQHPQILETLAPIIQASQLLQSRKTDDDVVTACEMCNKMSPQQIIKLLNLYTPADDFEERVPVSFIRKISQHLKGRGDSHDKPLLMDTKFNFPVRFPFNPSNIRLEDIEIPEVLNLPMLKKV
ncbi:dilute class unconventional myosin isoform X2 [Lycorma delicatula]